MKITVHAGPHDRAHCPVRAVLPEQLSSGAALLEQETGRTVPCQLRAVGGGSELNWILDSLGAGETRSYSVAEDTDVSLRTDAVAVNDDGQSVAVLVDGQLFTRYCYGPGYARPFLYPVIGPYGQGVTRGYPIVTDIAGERQDHPHHRSLYTAFGEVNGVDDWSESTGHGRIVHRGFGEVVGGSVFGRILAHLEWTDRDGKGIVEETRELVFYRTPSYARLLDYAVTFHSGEEPVTFGDTKEGGILSVRVATSMDVDREMGGRITNAYGGLNEQETWGQRSPWCDYSGPVGGRVVGIAVLEHPLSFRYPTQWHVRNYGLMTANCFGWSYYRNDKSFDGSHTMPPYSDLAFRYRVLVHSGRAEQVPIQFAAFAFPPQVTFA